MNDWSYYFGDNGSPRGKGVFMNDIANHTLYGDGLKAVIQKLETEKMLLNKPFSPKPLDMWDEDYLEFLEIGYISDYFSRAYLEHFGQVAEYIYQKKRKRKIITTVAVVATMAAVSLGVYFYLAS